MWIALDRTKLTGLFSALCVCSAMPGAYDRAPGAPSPGRLLHQEQLPARSDAERAHPGRGSCRRSTHAGFALEIGSFSLSRPASCSFILNRSAITLSTEPEVFGRVRRCHRLRFYLANLFQFNVNTCRLAGNGSPTIEDHPVVGRRRVPVPGSISHQSRMPFHAREAFGRVETQPGTGTKQILDTEPGTLCIDDA